MACGESNDYESGHLDRGTQEGYINWNPPEDCTNSTAQEDHFNVRLETSAEESPNEQYDQIANKKKWFIKSYFEDTPRSLLDRENCGWTSTDGRAYLREAEYIIEHGTGETNEKGVYNFQDAIPDNSDNALDELIGAALTVAGALSGGYVGAGAALISQFMPDYTDNYYTEEDFTNYSGDVKRRGHWQIPTEDAFPSAPCDSAAARITIETNTGAGAQHETDVFGRFSFNYATISEPYCPCTGGDPLRWYYKTTLSAYNSCEWETIA